MTAKWLTVAVTIVGTLAVWPTPGAEAQTLRETLIQTYQFSPQLEASRAQLRGVDEGVAIARSAKRPTLTGTVAGNIASSDSKISDGFDVSFGNTARIQLSSSLLLLDYGQTRAAIESARADVSAQRQLLRDVEQQVLLDAVSAFMDVRRDLQNLEVAQNNVRVLAEQVRATRDRFELGEVTRTDVSLSEARLASARATEAAVRGSLAISREAYQAVVGVPSGTLQTPPALPELPASLADAEAISMREQPQLNAARFSVTAAEFDVKRARAARGPSVTANGNITVQDEGFDFLGDNTGPNSESFSVAAEIAGSVPLYRGGELSALVRQSEAVLAQQQANVQATARAIRQNVAVAWSNLAVFRATIAANREEIEAARVAFEGIREEAALGARTTLDVLDLEQDLRDAQFQLLSSQRDEYVAAYQLLQAMGLLTVEHLNLGIPTYDPDVNFNRVQNAPYSTVEGNILEQLRDRYSR